MSTTSSQAVLFVLLTYLFSWIFWIPMVLEHVGFLSPHPLSGFLNSPFNPAPFGPLIISIVLSYGEGGTAGVRALLGRAKILDFSRIYLFPMLLLLPFFGLVSLSVGIAFGGLVPSYMWGGDPTDLIFWIPIAFVIILVLNGPLGEEFGWRGYALPRLQADFSALVSSIVLGVVWACWHMPLFFVFSEMYYARPFWELLVSAVAVSVLMTWLFNSTGGSVATALLFHTSLNLSHSLTPVTQSDLASLTYMVLLVLAAVAVVLLKGPSRLSSEQQQE
ncbi:MAG: type II CAAX endopeptidase family protein [Candidatus Thorarchaeota archaeon]